MKRCLYIIVFVLIAFAVPVFANSPLANSNKSGLYARSIDQVLRLQPDEVDIGIAALIVAEEWSEVVPGRRYQERLDDMAYEIRSRIEKQNLQNNPKAVNVINDYLFNELRFKAVQDANDANDLFLNSVMDRKRGYCLSLSILYLAVGERLDLPLYGVVVPGHFFVRYDTGSVRFNIEATSGGGSQDDEHYREQFKVPDNGYENLYLKNLNKMQSLGCLFNNLGNVYSQTGKLDAAMKALQNAVKINPSLAESRTNLGNIYLQQNKVDEAISQYRQALQINRDDAKTLNNLGNAYMQKNWYSDAIGTYEKALRIDSTFIDARINLALAHNKTGAIEQAIRLMKEAITMEPGKNSLYSNLGSIYFDAGRYEESMKQYKTAVQLNYKDAQAHYGLGICYNKLDMTQDEIRSFKDALAVKPDMAEAMAGLGNAYFKQKQYHEAIVQYQKAIQLAPDDPSLYYNLGAANSNEQKYLEAVRAYQKAVELNPDMGDAHNGLGYAYYSLKSYSMALKHLNRAKELGYAVDEKLLKAVKEQLQ